MTIKYKSKIEEKEFSKVCDLYKMSGWWKKSCSFEQISKLISGSFCFVTAWSGDDLVGMGRALSDAFNDAYIQDIFVDENYRKKGIATGIVKELLNYCISKNIQWIALIAAPGSVSVYEKTGFKKMDGYTPMQFQKID
ncbi:MAG: GNAT family N-acetyltransferase [Patescibacteria group bacterium]|nr:GNAT family N-acetyltransferase [Patescibacteria group bacterium]